MLYKLFEWHMLNWLVEESNMKERCANLLPLDSGWNLEKKKKASEEIRCSVSPGDLIIDLKKPFSCDLNTMQGRLSAGTI